MDSKAPIVLQVGEQYFHTSKSTLEGSTFLRSLTQRWNLDKQSDGSFFLDQDPEFFKHVLRLLRHGVFPLCYDKAKGHDFATYHGVHTLAKYLGVKELATWLNKKRYLEAVTVEADANIVGTDGGFTHPPASDVDVYYHPLMKTQKSKSDDSGGDEAWSATVVTKKTEFDGGVCTLKTR
ncbi:MAG: hypothetical protein Q9174_002963 [Haloplaca sp. 1 TL-2023]